MTSPSISTNDGIVQSGSSAASEQLTAARATDGKPAGPGVDPRLATAVDDTGTQNKKAADKADDGIERTKKDSKGKTEIDKGGADGLNGIGGAMLGALGAGASGLLGAAGQGGGAGGGMPQMPQVPASSAGQSMPAGLSDPKAAQAISRLLGGGEGTGAVGGGGLATANAGRGGSGTAGPTTPGGTEYEQRIIDLANAVVAAGIPYAWGGGALDGPGLGIRDGGAGDAAGDYAKTGFDCSGLARYLVYQASGVEIPRVSGDQYAAGQLISAADARPGDLAFDNDPSRHVMIYVGDGKVVEAQQSGTNIMFSDAASRGVTQYVRVVSGG
ncbi:C40 family peptidase [Mycolicibacterium sp.]|uniref:C40 family peptidase n=1 Tax=Mycolicibacterium sp. TaxID=2320850 RepID=UPI0035607FB6